MSTETWSRRAAARTGASVITVTTCVNDSDGMRSSGAGKLMRRKNATAKRKRTRFVNGQKVLSAMASDIARFYGSARRLDLCVRLRFFRLTDFGVHIVIVVLHLRAPAL